MLTVKSVDLVTIRKMIQAPKTLEAILAKLSPENRALFMKTCVSEWLPLQTNAEFLQICSEVIYPRDSLGLEKMDQEVARITYSGIYRAFLRIASVDFLIKRTAAIWHLYYNKGEAKAEKEAAQRVILAVNGFPELTQAHRKYIRGYVAGMVELTHASQIRVEHLDNDPQHWKWVTEWEK
jgi:hypothetical protein